MQTKMDMEMGLKVQEFIRLTVVLITSILKFDSYGAAVFFIFRMLELKMYLTLMKRHGI